MRRGRGRALIELVEYWSGKEAPGKVLHFSPNKREACEQTLAQYEKLLTFLKTSGALLNAVKPEMLLDEKDFHRLAQTYRRRIDHREVSRAEADRMRLWMDLDATPPGREKMAAVSAAAWRLTLMQTIKIFVLSRRRRRTPRSRGPTSSPSRRESYSGGSPRTSTRRSRGRTSRRDAS
jgi:hypothetical protein